MSTLSAKTSGQAALIFALETQNSQMEDLAGIGSMAEMVMSSFRRQLKFIAVPAVLSIAMFCGTTLPVIAGVFGAIIYVGFGIICAFMIPALVLGMTVIKKKLKLFPSRAVLTQILRQEGFALHDLRHSF